MTAIGKLLLLYFKLQGLPRLPRISTKVAADQGQFFERFLQTNFEGYYEWSACHVLAPDLENLLQHECATLKVVGRILTCSKSFFVRGVLFQRKMLHEQLIKVFL